MGETSQLAQHLFGMMARKVADGVSEWRDADLPLVTPSSQ